LRANFISFARRQARRQRRGLVSDHLIRGKRVRLDVKVIPSPLMA
jgi:hypothetical protein